MAKSKTKKRGKKQGRPQQSPLRTEITLYLNTFMGSPELREDIIAFCNENQPDILIVTIDNSNGALTFDGSQIPDFEKFGAKLLKKPRGYAPGQMKPLNAENYVRPKECIEHNCLPSALVFLPEIDSGDSIRASFWIVQRKEGGVNGYQGALPKSIMDDDGVEVSLR